jgi:AraC family transcriptional regulator
MPPIQVMRYYFASNRESFTLTEDKYEGWVILAAHRGSFSFEVEGIERTIEPAGFGDLVICPPGCKLSRESLGVISFHFIEFVALEDVNWPAGKIRIRDAGRLGSTFDYLCEWHEAAEVQAPDSVLHLVKDILFIVERERRLTARNFIIDAAMQQAAAFIENHACNGELSLQLLAAHLGIGPSQLTRRFQAAYGMSPVRYATKVRLSKARRLLAETKDTIDTISEQCGFQNAFYFSRVFTRHLQISPSAYRRTFLI